MDRLDTLRTDIHPLPSSLPPSVSLAERFLPAHRSFPAVKPSGIHVLFHEKPEERVAAIRSITPKGLSFAERVNRELDRTSAYYESVGMWANLEHRATLLAGRLGVTSEDYKALLTESKMNSWRAFEVLLRRAEQQGLSPDDVAKAVSQARSIEPKPTARQRMLMMKGVMNSTPVIVADLLSSSQLGSYGFGDGTKNEIFAGKVNLGDISFSATASPRLYKEPGVKDSGYVFRFCVGKCAFPGFEEDHPVYMLDNKVVETLSAWHAHAFPGTPLNQNPLLESMAKLLMVPTHDWGHSWLLYDTNARTSEFKEWGNDIYQVPHVDGNKLLINYEILTLSMHKYTWQLLCDSDPKLQPSIFTELERYHAAVLDFAAFVKGRWDEERATKEENYLMYIPLSTLPCVIDWKDPQLKGLFEQYPIVREQVTRILGNVFDILGSHRDGVPAKSKGGSTISTAEYIRAYPLQEEMAARLRQERLAAMHSADGGGVSTEFFRAFRELPECISNQFGSEILDPSVLPTLRFALEKLRDDVRRAGGDSALLARLHERVRVGPTGHLFFKINRDEVDYDRLTVCEQDKRVLLVEVPEGSEIPLRPRIRTNLASEVTKQVTKVTGSDMIAFNVQSEAHALEILRAGKGLEGTERVNAMIAKGNEMGRVLSVSGAQDIYPIRRSVAEMLYGSAQTGYRELLGRRRFGCATYGPVELNLHDGSDQRTLAGVLVYVPSHDANASFNADPDPDLHGIEAGVFDRTYSATAASVEPFYLRRDIPLTQGSDATAISKALHSFVAALSEVNLQLDLGSSSGQLGRGLFVIQ